MGAKFTVGTMPSQLVRAPAGFGLYFRITVTNTAAFLPALLPGAVLPTIPAPGPGGNLYVFKSVDLQSETDPLSIAVRYTDDGQTVPTATVGYIVPGGASWIRIPADPQDIQLISTGANVFVQCRLGIAGTSTGGN